MREPNDELLREYFGVLIMSFPRNSPTSRGTALRLGQEASLQCWFLDHGHRENVHLDEKRAFLLVALSRRVPDLSRRDGDYTATWLPPVSGNAVFRPELNFARPGGPSPSSPFFQPADEAGQESRSIGV